MDQIEIEMNVGECVFLVNAPARLSGGLRKDLRSPLGLLYLGTVLREHGFDVRLFDFERRDESWERLDTELASVERCIVGFSCDSESTFRAVRASERLLHRHDHLMVVLGGHHVTHLPERYAAPRRVVARGEAENTLLLLARHFLRGDGHLEDVPGITYVSEGELRSNPVDLGQYEAPDAIPFPDYSLLRVQDDYIPAVITARGCQYDCHFCSEGRSRRAYRPRSPENVEAELRTLKERWNGHLPYMTFNDDTFTGSYDRVMSLCDVLDRVFPDKSQFGFFCEGRVNILARHPTLVRRLHDAGLLRLQIGIESGQQELLDSMNKRTRRDEIETVVRLCEESGIRSVFGAFICGLPGQTEAHVRADIEFAKHLADLAPGRVETEMSCLTPLPGTEYRIHADQWSLDIHDPEFVEGWVIESCFAETRELPRRTIERLVATFKAEIDRYLFDQTCALAPDRIREAFRLAVERHLLLLSVRHLCRFRHATRVLELRSRVDHRFLSELSSDEGWSAPVECDSTVVPWTDGYLVNQGSPKAFLLSEDELAVFQHFRGKLTLAEIADRLATKWGRSREATQSRCDQVYGKAEDNLAAIMMI